MPELRTSIVMITRDRRERVLATIPRLLEVDGCAQVIVVDDDSSDGTSAAVRERFPDVLVIQTPGNLGAGGRTLGVAAAGTPYVAFADDDSWYGHDALERAADALDRFPSLAVVAGSVTVEPGGRPDPVNRLMADSPLGSDGLPGPEVLGFIACSAVVRRDAYLAVGGFDARLLVGGEEELLTLDLRAAGWRCAYVDSVRAHHAPEAADARPGRGPREVRNRLWVAWLRRPPSSVVRIFASSLRRAVRDRNERAGLRDAVTGLRRLAGDRRTIPPDVEHDKRATERMAAT